MQLGITVYCEIPILHVFTGTQQFFSSIYGDYMGVMISLWRFLFPIFIFAAQPKEFFLGGLKKSEQRNHKCVELRRKMYCKYIFSIP
jgi:hypothetical protein